MNTYNETLNIMNKYKIKADKSLGQNFLINEEVINEIIEKANVSKNDIIIEIGPGLGVLTNRLLQKSDNVIVVELDKRMVEILQDRFANNDNLTIINDDILKVDLDEIIEKQRGKIEEKGNGQTLETTEKNIKVKIVANLPYYISTPIIMKLLEKYKKIDEIIVMVQKEMADRLTAKTGTRLAGSITYAIEYYSHAEKIILVSKESFIPSPKVESEVIKLKVRENPKIAVKDENKLFDIIQKSFSQRRKTLGNALVNYNFAKNKKEVEEMFKTLEISSNIRGENLTLEQFGKISDYYS